MSPAVVNEDCFDKRSPRKEIPLTNSASLKFTIMLESGTKEIVLDLFWTGYFALLIRNERDFDFFT